MPIGPTSRIRGYSSPWPSRGSRRAHSFNKGLNGKRRVSHLTAKFIKLHIGASEVLASRLPVIGRCQDLEQPAAERIENQSMNEGQVEQKNEDREKPGTVRALLAQQEKFKSGHTLKKSAVMSHTKISDEVTRRLLLGRLQMLHKRLRFLKAVRESGFLGEDWRLGAWVLTRWLLIVRTGPALPVEVSQRRADPSMTVPMEIAWRGEDGEKTDMLCPLSPPKKSWIGQTNGGMSAVDLWTWTTLGGSLELPEPVFYVNYYNTRALDFSSCFCFKSD
ncbi:hypothetical protein B0H11DRAFT_2334771 [Mycena galericulata]|nr:hypothetical protein B0H11DRAFT_2334771 [Mycena galericulata]